MACANPTIKSIKFTTGKPFGDNLVQRSVNKPVSRWFNKKLSTCCDNASQDTGLPCHVPISTFCCTVIRIHECYKQADRWTEHACSICAICDIACHAKLKKWPEKTWHQAMQTEDNCMKSVGDGSFGETPNWMYPVLHPPGVQSCKRQVIQTDMRKWSYEKCVRRPAKQFKVAARLSRQIENHWCSSQAVQWKGILHLPALHIFYSVVIFTLNFMCTMR